MTITEQQTQLRQMQEEIVKNNELLLKLLKSMTPEDQKIYAPKVEALITNILKSYKWQGSKLIQKT